MDSSLLPSPVGLGAKAPENFQPQAGQIMHIKACAEECQKLGLRFEWHMNMQAVFVIRRNPQGQEFGDPLARTVTSEGLAINCVLIFLRGFREGRAHAHGEIHTIGET